MTTEELDFTRICRVCCLNGTHLSLFKVHLNRKLMSCANVKIWKDDGLPASICSKCISKLHIAFQFKKTCEKSDAKLRNILENAITSKAKICQEMPQQQQPISPQNYMDISNIISNGEINKSIGSGITNLVTTQTYSLNPINTLDGVTNNQFQSQNASVQYQTFCGSNTNQPNDGVIQIIPSVPLQPIIGNNNDSIIGTKMSTLTYDELVHQGQINNETDCSSCSTCGKRFSTLTKLSRHIKTHSQIVTHQCKICHKGFTHGGNFKVHMRIHNNEKPFSCSMCDHRCRQLQDLEKHKRKHNGEKPYICRYCNKGFSTSSNLISHERIHRKEKPYVCSICQKAFCQSNELTKHFRTHTQEKSHICNICQKGFNGSSTLIVHMRTHNNERPHICHFCQKGFTQSSCLKAHIKRHMGKKLGNIHES